MSSLKAFMAPSAPLEITKEVEVSKRFKDENGAPIKWQVKAISQDQDDAIRKECTETVMMGKIPMKQLNSQKYSTKWAAACTVFPDLNDAELQNSYGVMGAEHLLKKMLLPGEFTTLYTAVEEVNGYEPTFSDKVEEAKN